MGSSPMMVCIRPGTYSTGPDGNVWSRLTTPGAVSAALQEPCEDGGCHSAHLIAFRDQDGTHVLGSKPEKLPLEVELAQLYPPRRPTARERRHPPPPIELWPTPDEWNPPLDAPAGPSFIAEREDHAALLRQPESALYARLAGDLALPVPATPATAASAARADLGRYPPLVFPTRRQCTVKGCWHEIAARGLCQKHYDAAKNRGELDLYPLERHPRKKRCHSPAPPEKPESAPSPPATPPTSPSPLPWRARWARLRASS